MLAYTLLEHSMLVRYNLMRMNITVKKTTSKMKAKPSAQVKPRGAKVKALASSRQVKSAPKSRSTKPVKSGHPIPAVKKPVTKPVKAKAVKPVKASKTVKPLSKNKQSLKSKVPPVQIKKPVKKTVLVKKAAPKSTAPKPNKKAVQVRPKAFSNVTKPAKKASPIKTKATPIHKPIEPSKNKTSPKPVVNKPTHRKHASATEGKQFTRAELNEFYHAMLDLCKRLSLQVTELRQQSLLRHDEVNQDEDGTDAFERVTSLDRASADQSQIFQINTAIRAIIEGTYGLCESCGEKIERPRLQALPFAKTCIKCQSVMEGGGDRRRPTTDLLD